MFLEEQLKNLIRGNVVGELFPYNTKREQEIEMHLRRLFYRINRIPHLRCEAEWDHFGSGYASFVEFFCWREEDAAVRKVNTWQSEEERQGIIVDICRLAPVAIMGEDIRQKTIQDGEEVGGAYGSLLEGPRRLHINGKLEPVANQLKQVLKEFGIEVLEANAINGLLPFKTAIPTFYRKPKDYLVMDAIFYWED